MTAEHPAAAWHTIAGHLVREHGDSPQDILRYTPSTGVMHEAHDSDHQLGLGAPHRHAEPLPQGDPAWAPFRPAADRDEGSGPNSGEEPDEPGLDMEAG
jgi:hypothetical protein